MCSLFPCSQLSSTHKFTESVLAFRREETWITRSRVRFHETSLRDEWVVKFRRKRVPGMGALRKAWLLATRNETMTKRHHASTIILNRSDRWTAPSTRSVQSACRSVHHVDVHACTVVARGRERDSRDVLFIAHTTNAEKKKKTEER